MAESTNASTLDKMIHALELEVEAIKKRGGASSIVVSGGSRRSSIEGHTIYAFPLTEDLHLRDDSPIRLTVGSDKVDGTIVSISENLLIVALERDLGPSIPTARIVCDNSFLIERLKTRLCEVRDSKEFHHENAARVIGEAPNSCTEVELDSNFDMDKLKPEQINAVKKALGSDVSFIWGPPGTGKTTTIGYIVEGFFRQGKSVLIASNTNIAVDTALMKVCDRFKTSPDFQASKFLRHGPMVAESGLEEKYGEQVNIDGAVARLGRSLQEENVSLENEVSSRIEEQKSVKEILNDYDKLHATKENLSLESNQALSLRNKHKDAIREITQLEQRRNQKESDLHRAKSMGQVARFFKGLNIPRLQNELLVFSVPLAVAKDVLNAIEREHDNVRSRMNSLDQEFKQINEIVKKHPPLEICQAEFRRIEDILKILRQRIKEIEERLAKLRDEIIKNCRVLATTVYRTYLKGQVERDFDVVIIDEASMLMLPMVYFAAGRATKEVVVAGDFRQLPPIVLSDSEEAKQWLKTDVFYKFGIAQAVDEGLLPKELTQLKRQFRMDPQICDLVNNLFYPASNHRLITDESVKIRQHSNWPLEDHPLFYVDTSSLNPWCALQLGTYSRYNLLHALIVRNIVYYLQERGNIEIGVISPFAAQTRLLRSLMPKESQRFVATVHRFQGNEKAFMIVDLTEAKGTRPSKFLCAKSIEEDGARLLNVAFSRAKERIILMADFDYLRNQYGRQTYTRMIIDHFEAYGKKWEVRDTLSIGPDEWFWGLEGLFGTKIEFDPNLAGIFNEGNFYSAFRQDILSANESILIFSPFVTEHGAGRWMDIIRERLLRGVKVRIVTKPPSEQGGALGKSALNEIFAAMEEMGIVVDFRARMHEKFAIIDNTVIWHGSLNILSHRDTTESMIRFPTTKLGCQGFLRLVSSAVASSKEGEGTSFSQRENPTCPECHGWTVLKSGRYGIYFECMNCGWKISSRQSKREKKRQKKDESPNQLIKDNEDSHKPEQEE